MVAQLQILHLVLLLGFTSSHPDNPSPMEIDMANLKRLVNTLMSDMDRIKVEANIMRDKVVTLQAENVILKAEVTNLRADEGNATALISGLEVDMSSLKFMVHSLKQAVQSNMEEKEDIRVKFHDTKMFVLKKVQALEEKLKWALDGQSSTQSTSAQEALALTQLRESGDMRPLPDIISNLTTTGYTTCREAYTAGPGKPGLYKLHGNSSLPTIVYCSMKEMIIYADCIDAYEKGQHISGIYNIRLADNTTKQVWCEQEKYGGGWTVFQVRRDGSVDFYRNWVQYKNGFGQLSSEFWLGLDTVNLLTTGRGQSLLVELVRTDGTLGIAKYAQFFIENEAAGFKLHVSGFSGSAAGDSLTYHSNHVFSTKDHGVKSSCAKRYSGAWWYNSCHYSNLNGLYSDKNPGNPRGVAWYHWSDKNAYQYVTSSRMMMRTAI